MTRPLHRAPARPSLRPQRPRHAPRNSECTTSSRKKNGRAHISILSCVATGETIDSESRYSGTARAPYATALECVFLSCDVTCGVTGESVRARRQLVLVSVELYVRFKTLRTYLAKLILCVDITLPERHDAGAGARHRVTTSAGAWTSAASIGASIRHREIRPPRCLPSVCGPDVEYPLLTASTRYAAAVQRFRVVLIHQEPSTPAGEFVVVPHHCSARLRQNVRPPLHGLSRR